MKPTAASIDKKAANWSLSWQPDGRCDNFTRDSILACAPSTSGVYGLFNFDCQVFIGASANIRGALLRHISETDFQSQHLRPTGFTFEACALELCKPQVDELIAKFRPVLQSEAVLTETRAPANAPMPTEVGQSGNQIRIDTDHHEFPAHESERQPKGRRRFHFKRVAAALAGIFLAGALIVFYFGMPADYAIQQRASGANPNSTEMPGTFGNQTGEPMPAKPAVGATVQKQNGAVRLAAKTTPAVDGPSIPAKRIPITNPAESAKSSKKWSVQISAVPAKDVADTLIQQLKAKGYDSYLAQVEVKGQTYYRVRVGHFDEREKAEIVRQSLARQEGYRDAYLTGD